MSKQELMVEMGLFEQRLRNAGSQDAAVLKAKLEEMSSLFEQCKSQGRMAMNEEDDAEKTLMRFDQLISQLTAPTSTSLFASYLFPSKRKVLGFFKSHGEKAPNTKVEAAQESQQMRKELLFSKRQENQLRNRKNDNWSQSEGDAPLAHHEKVQDQLLSDMHSLTKALKHNISSSGKIIREDVKVLNEAVQNAGTNLGKLKNESTRLDQHLSKSSCWLWTLILLVVVLFIFMIFFIRFFPKR